MKKLPIGVSNYKELIEGGYYYVDKSLLIKDIHESGKVVLMPRPRRFGKTLNLSMIRYFLELSKESNAHLFKDTLIGKLPQYQNVQGTFPVIFVTFKDIKETSWDVAYEKFAITLYEEFDRHNYLLSSDHIKSYEKEFYTRILERRASQAELETSLHFLAKLLHAYYKKKPYLLIDEYDVPIQASFVHGYYEKAIGFLKGLLGSALKDEDHIEQGIVTGILTLAKAGIFTGLNNLDVFNITNTKLSDKFGFTQEEVGTILHQYGLNALENEIQQWYNGYTFGVTSGIFNPWSVLNCIKNRGQLKKYWVNTSDNILVKKLIAQASIDVKRKLERLISGTTIAEKIEESLTFPDLDNRSDLLWSLLLFTGYLSYEHYTLKEGEIIASLKIPNKEITYLYNDLIRNIFKESVLGGQVDNLLTALTVGDSDMFSTLLQSFVYTSMSSYDLSSNEPEKSYHLFVLGLLVALSDHYEVKSNKESGLGRYDLTIIPRKNNKPAIILEFKIVRKGETLETAAQKALDQISQKKYTQDLFDRSIEKIIAYGIAFEGRTIMVKSTRIDKP